MVPVQVAKKYGAAKRTVLEQGAQGPYTGPGVDDKAWRVPIVGNGHTGGVTAVTGKFITGGGG